MSKLLTLTEDNLNQAIEKYPLLVVDCWATWCTPCEVVTTMIEKLAEEYEERVAFGTLDVESNPAIVERYEILALPTLLIFKGDQLVNIRTGTVPRHILEEELLEYLL